MKIPTAPGSYDINVKMWVPRGGIRSEMRNFFVGGAYRLHDLRSIEMPTDMGGASFLSKFGFRTEKSGSLRIRVNVVTHHLPPEIISDSNDMGVSQTLSGGRSSVDDILSRVRSNRNNAATRGKNSPKNQSPLRRRSQMMDSFNFSGTEGSEEGATTDSGRQFPYKTALPNMKMDSTADVLAKVRSRREARNKDRDAGSTIS